MDDIKDSTMEEELESAANMLRGMTLDPAIPEHAKEAMRHRYERIEAFLEGFADTDEGDGYWPDGSEEEAAN